MKRKPSNFGYNLWVAASTHGCGIQFHPYTGKDASYDSELGLVAWVGGSVVISLRSKLTSMNCSKYPFITDDFFTSPRALGELTMKAITGTGTVELKKKTEKAPLKAAEEMKKKTSR